jgi:RES domain-containing protein
VGFILLARGRWNREGEYGCLYTSLTRKGAIAEYHKELSRVVGVSPEEDQPRDLVSIYVRAQRVLDLTKAPVRTRFGVTLAAIQSDRSHDVELCRTVGDLARLQGYNAILSPSAASSSEKNLNLYIDGRAGDVRLSEGTHREALNYR